ncbi:MAG TPA: peptidylprolyl isomerase, partial [Gemmatimonadales bacterium]|nr:peptidylprolyl isomerase [Gemmatimonadales bacterium]
MRSLSLPLLRRALVLLVCGFAVGYPAAAQTLPRVIIQTELGDIEVEVDSIHAPVTAANFLRYVDLGFYRFGRFHRTVTAANQPTNKVKIAVIQAGLDSLRVRDFPPIKLE